jgi:2'-5' RNA ligase
VTVRLTKAAEQSGAMVALYPSPSVAEELAVDGGEAASDLHLTLAFLGDAADISDPLPLVRAVESVAAGQPPLTGEISGLGHFTSGEEPVTYASPDLPDLPAFRQELVEALTAVGHEPSTEHGFSPHITLAYALEDPDVPNLPLSFDRVSLVIGGERTDFPLDGVTAADRSDMKLLDRLFRDIDKAEYSTEQRIKFAEEGKAIPIKEDGKIVGGRYPIDNEADLKNAISAYGRASDKAEAKAHIVRQAKRLKATDALPDDWDTSGSGASKSERTEIVVDLWKDEEKRFVYGVAMQPTVKDSAGDWQTAEDIEKTAHRWLAEYRKHDIQHGEEQAAVVPVESFIAPVDFEYAGRPVLKGSWVIGARVDDDATWEQVRKGELTGWSIGGTAIRGED